MKKVFIFLFILSNFVFAEVPVFQFELQGVGGWVSNGIAKDENKIVSYSNNKYDSMQQNSIGFKYLDIFLKDITLAIQFRLAYINAEKQEIQPQIYDLYIKTNDIWIGHNKIGYGLNSIYDTDAELLQFSTFSRDWGFGYEQKMDNGSLKVSLTTGSGMSLIVNKNIIYDSNVKNNKLEGKSNYLVSGRADIGFLKDDNYNFGISIMHGRIFDTESYKISNIPLNITKSAIDASLNFSIIENKAQIEYSKKDILRTFSALYKVGIKIVGDDDLKIEGQINYKRNNYDTEVLLNNINLFKDIKRLEYKDIVLSAGFSSQLDVGVSFRGMYEWSEKTKEQKVIGQIYLLF